MSVATFYLWLSIVLFLMGFLALVIRSSNLNRVIAINVMGLGVFMWLLSAAYHGDQPDSVPHALVLTGIVVAVCATAYALALLTRITLRERDKESR